MPYVIDGDGNCHVYVDAAADLDMAAAIVVNAKTQRPVGVQRRRDAPGPRAVAPAFLWRVAAASRASSWSATSRRAPPPGPPGAATDDDWATEFLDLKLAVRVVDSLATRPSPTSPATARATARPSSPRPGAADRFMREVDAAAGPRQRLDPVRRRRGVRLRGRDRHHHPEAPRPRPDGPAGADHPQVRRPRRPARRRRRLRRRSATD